jgi:hypothetical protein
MSGRSDDVRLPRAEVDMTRTILPFLTETVAPNMPSINFSKTDETTAIADRDLQAVTEVGCEFIADYVARSPRVWPKKMCVGRRKKTFAKVSDLNGVIEHRYGRPLRRQCLQAAA